MDKEKRDRIINFAYFALVIVFMVAVFISAHFKSWTQWLFFGLEIATLIVQMVWIGIYYWKVSKQTAKEQEERTHKLQ